MLLMFVLRAGFSMERRGLAEEDGDGSVSISGELKQWHKVTLTVRGPYARETDENPNPFLDICMMVDFRHEDGQLRYEVPGYFAADGNAANSSADRGNCWRAHLSPDLPGRWTYTVRFWKGYHVAIEPQKRQQLEPFLERTGSFQIAPTDKTAPDFRYHGRLTYVGKRYLLCAGSKQYFLKAGADSPETLLAYADFDGTEAARQAVQRAGEARRPVSLHEYRPHIADWHHGDPTWKQDKGKGLIGVINYLSSKGVNALSFLPYNAGGDGDNVWPFVSRNDKLHYDCSKLDQWAIVFDHAMARGMFLHFKLQEQEIDDNRQGPRREMRTVPESLDGGQLGPERKLYCRELIARFGYLLALNWNIGEENTQSAEEQRAMIRYIFETDPYKHPIVLHTFPDQQDEVYEQLLGQQSLLMGVSLQNPWSNVHQRTLRWIQASEKAGRPWVVANDEQNPASHGVPPDPEYSGFDGTARPDRTGASGATDQPPRPGQMRPYTLHDIRKYCLWGNIMAGGAGVEYYFGYQLPQNDLNCEDFRSRDKTWDYCRIALEFFRTHQIPLDHMQCRDDLVGNTQFDNSRYCLAATGEMYLVYLPVGGTTDLDLRAEGSRSWTVLWYDPRNGGKLQEGTVRTIHSPAVANIGLPPRDEGEDWLAIIR